MTPAQIADLLIEAERRSPTRIRRRKQAPLTTAQRREATRRYNLGHAPAVIARYLGATIPTVRRYVLGAA